MSYCVSEVTVYEKITLGIYVCVCQFPFILFMYLTKAMKSQYSVHVITYINNTTTILHMIHLLNLT